MPFGFGRGRGRGSERRAGKRGMGRGGSGRRMMPHRAENCICPVCNTLVPHQIGMPCYQTACPNCGALMTRQFNVPGYHPLTQQPGVTTTPKVDQDICNGCGLCISACPTEAIELINKKAVIRADRCTNCRACIETCPVSAIK